MPAIPVHARIEAHMSDTQLIALVGLFEHLLIAHHEHHSPIFSDAAKEASELANDMREGLCITHAAARRAIRERGLMA